MSLLGSCATPCTPRVAGDAVCELHKDLQHGSTSGEVRFNMSAIQICVLQLA